MSAPWWKNDFNGNVDGTEKVVVSSWAEIDTFMELKIKFKEVVLGLMKIWFSSSA